MFGSGLSILCIISVFQMVYGFDITKHSDHDIARVTSVSVSACPGAEGEFCCIKLGANVTYQVEFESLKPFKRAVLQVGSREGDEYTDFSYNLACNYLGLICPSEGGQRQTLTHVTQINRDTGSSHLRLRLYDELKNIIFSIQFPIKLLR